METSASIGTSKMQSYQRFSTRVCINTAGSRYYLINQGVRTTSDHISGTKIGNGKDPNGVNLERANTQRPLRYFSEFFDKLNFDNTHHDFIGRCMDKLLA